MLGPVEADPEYQLIVESNNMLVELDTEISELVASTCLWTLSTMTSKNKNGGYSWGTLHGRPMEGLAFRYDRHEEIERYIQMWRIYYHLMVIRVLITFKIFWLVLLFQMP